MPSAFTLVVLLIALALTATAAKRDLRLPYLLTLAAFVSSTYAAALIFGPTAAPVGALCVVCALIAETDRRHTLIPDLMTLTVLALSLTMPFGDGPVLQALGAALLGGVFLAIRQACSAWRGVDALGWGDVKLAGAMGAVLGPTFGFAAVAFAGLATLTVLAARARGGAVATGAPFGIGLAAATAAVAITRLVLP